MRYLRQKNHFYTLSKYNQPEMRVRSGETIVVETVDNTGNRIKTKEDVAILPTMERFNPMSGPIFVEDARPGDTLSIKIEDVRPLSNQGWCGEFPGVLSAAGDAYTGLYLIHEPRPFTVYICSLEEGMVRIPFNDGREVRVPLSPFPGVIGVAPGEETAPSSICGAYGGNMDCPDLIAGNTLFLPVFAEGAFVYIGDAHATQGDGELGGAVDIPAECTLTISVIKGKAIKWPRIESPDYFMTVGNSCPLDNSLRIANTEMLLWLRDEYGFDLADAIQLSSAVAKCRINSVINPAFSSVSVKFPKEYLPPANG